MAIYSVEKLMRETRRLAAQYHQTTGQSLPVTLELARYDALRLLELKLPPQSMTGVDAIGVDWAKDKKIQIKGRVIFDEAKGGHRVGQLCMGGDWDYLVLVLLNASYEPISIYQTTHDEISAVLKQSSSSKRGAISVAKIKAMGNLVWSYDVGVDVE